MNREDIIRLAREAKLDEHLWYTTNESEFVATERFAALVAAHEREACERECSEIAKTAKSESSLSKSYLLEDGILEGVMQCVAAIRARGEKP